MRIIPAIRIITCLTIIGCSRAPQAEQPAPQQPTTMEIARQQHEQDSLKALAAAAADSAERVAAAGREQQRVADSTAQARVAAEEVIRLAGERDQALRAELAVMVHFDTDNTELGSDARAALDRKIVILNANPDIRLRITGACDERGSAEHNMALGRRRAATVKKYLIAQGVTDTRLEEATAGEGSPLDDGNEEAAWARNRRAEFLMIDGNAPLAMR